MNKFRELKDRLYNYSRAVAIKKELELKYQELESEIGIGAVESSEGKSYGISKITERQAMKLAEQKEKIENFIKIEGFKIDRVDNLLSILNEREKNVIIFKYIKRYRIEVISTYLDRSSKTIKRIEHTALEKMNNILKMQIK